MSEMSCEVWFYHLERTSLDQALPELLEKTLARDWRALVRTPSPERIEHLDGWLWSYRDDAFLPHGTEHEPMAERQPVLITSGLTNPNRADALAFRADACKRKGDYDRAVVDHIAVDPHPSSRICSGA